MTAIAYNTAYICHHPNTLNTSNPTPSKYQSPNIPLNSIPSSFPPANHPHSSSINYSTRRFLNSTCQSAPQSKKQLTSTTASTTNSSCKTRKSITNSSKWFLIVTTSLINSTISRYLHFYLRKQSHPKITWSVREERRRTSSGSSSVLLRNARRDMEVRDRWPIM